MPTPAPMMTMAALTNSSGLIASFRRPDNWGKKLPMIRPASRARTKPASPVSFSDQLMPNLVNSAGVVAAMWAWLPATQQTKLMANTSVKATANFLRLPPDSQLPTPTTNPMNRYVETTASQPGIHLNEAATGVMALERSVHVPTFAPKPKTSAPRKTPKESRKTARPVQSESQSSLILDLRSIISLFCATARTGAK